MLLYTLAKQLLTKIVLPIKILVDCQSYGNSWLAIDAIILHREEFEQKAVSSEKHKSLGLIVINLTRWIWFKGDFYEKDQAISCKIRENVNLSESIKPDLPLWFSDIHLINSLKIPKSMNQLSNRVITLECLTWNYTLEKLVTRAVWERKKNKQ